MEDFCTFRGNVQVVITAPCFHSEKVGTVPAGLNYSTFLVNSRTRFCTDCATETPPEVSPYFPSPHLFPLDCKQAFHARGATHPSPNSYTRCKASGTPGKPVGKPGSGDSGKQKCSRASPAAPGATLPADGEPRRCSGPDPSGPQGS